VNNKIAIVGNCKTLNEQMSFNTDTDYFFVGHGLYSKCLRDNNYLDNFNFGLQEVMLLEIHSRESRQERYPEYMEWLKTVKVSKYMQEYYSDIIFSYKYEREKIWEYFQNKGATRRNFMVSFSYMVAFAIYKGYKRIELYNINMVYGDDYIQKYSFEYWLGIAIGCNIEVALTPECDLLRCKAYGYDVDNTLGVYQQRALQAIQLNILKDINFVMAYLGDLVSSITEKDDPVIVELLEILQNKLISAKNGISALYIEHPKFMKEILDRHGIDIKPQKFDEGDKD
jgi:hypothetical protein